jgi:hypothetical protein
MDKIESLLAQFNDPDGVIDDPEELLNEIPGWLEEIVRLRDELKSARACLAAVMWGTGMNADDIDKMVEHHRATLEGE